MIGSKKAQSNLSESALRALERTVGQSGRFRVSSWPSALLDWQLEARKKLKRIGIPHNKVEDWKYVDLNDLIKIQYKLGRKSVIEKSDIARFTCGSWNVYCVVLVNGFYRPELSQTRGSGLRIKQLHQAGVQKIKKDLGALATIEDNADGLTALNAAHVNDGLHITVPGDQSPEKPLLILHMVDDRQQNIFSQTRIFIDVKKSSRLGVIEQYASFGMHDNWQNIVNEVRLAEKADVQWYRLQGDSGQGKVTQRTVVHQSEHSRFRDLTLSLEGSFLRNDLQVLLDGREAKAEMNGLYRLAGRQVVDNHTVVEHTAPECRSEQLYKGLMNGRSTAVFNGKVIVHPNAQKTIANQLNKNIVLSDNATINTKPQLEIFADDVQCSHGATTGDFDDAAVFYLRSRGLSAEDAKQLLLQGFVDEIINHIDLMWLRSHILKTYL